MTTANCVSIRLPNLLSWHREITDALTLYSVSIVACAITFYSPLFADYVKFAQTEDGIQSETITIVLLFLGIASTAFGLRRLADQRKERARRVAAEEQANSLSLCDPLTLLPNRRCLQNEFESPVMPAGDTITILMAGLKRFDLINNLHDHSGGDAVISQVAARLRREAENIGFLARVAEDEFAIVINNQDVDRIARIAHLVVEHIRRPVRIGILEHAIEAHAGIAQFSPEQSKIGEVLRHARVALNRARELGMDCCFYDQEMDRHIRRRALLERDFREALTNRAICPHFQPIVNVRSGKIVSFEALARWTHPEHGSISPEIFIPLAEDLGLMNCLSAQLFREACRQASGWSRDITLSFNFSPNQLRDAHFGDTVLAALDETRLAPDRLEVEITEGALVNDFAVARQILLALKSAGASIVMDDFGTGYSSLRHLRELQFDKIKIDRSFVQELASKDDCAAIVSAVAGLCRCLDIDTVAEGIETEEQLQLVRAAGCTHAQGFLFARPRSALDLEFKSFNSAAEQVRAACPSGKRNRPVH